MTVYIFGDSFCDPAPTKSVRRNPCKIPDLRPNHTPWHQMFSEPVINHGLSGTGVLYSFFKLYSNLPIFEKFDKIVFFISNYNRIFYPDFPVELQYAIQYDTNVKTKFENDLIMDYISKYHDHIRFYHEVQKYEKPFQIIKDLTYLKHIAHQYQLKVITFMAGFGEEVDDDLNDERFAFYPKGMFEVSFNELKEKTDSPFKNDPRLNHLSEVNHYILYQFIHDFFYTNQYNEPIFKNKLLDNDLFEFGNDYKDFIYD